MSSSPIATMPTQHSMLAATFGTMAVPSGPQNRAAW